VLKWGKTNSVNRKEERITAQQTSSPVSCLKDNRVSKKEQMRERSDLLTGDVKNRTVQMGRGGKQVGQFMRRGGFDDLEITKVPS